MADEQSTESKAQTTESGTDMPAPEALKPQIDGSDSDRENNPEDPSAGGTDKPKEGDAGKPTLRLRRTAYRPSHKATFIGLIVVVLILAGNAAIIAFVIKSQSSEKSKAVQDSVTINQSALEKLGVNRNPVGSSGVELTVNPNARFNGKLQVGGDVTVGGQFKLNSKFTASDATLTNLEAGKTSLSELNVNGDGTLSTMNLRKDLVVAGTTRLQGDVILTRLLTVNNSANVAGNLAVGGTLTVGNFQTRSIVSDTTITLGGHFITRGALIGFQPGTGSVLGTGGTSAASGNDVSGTISAGVGVGATGGLVGTVNFRQAYTATPRIVVTGSVVSGGGAIRNVYISRTTTGFSLFVADPLQPGAYAFDYIVMQ